MTSVLNLQQSAAAWFSNKCKSLTKQTFIGRNRRAQWESWVNGMNGCVFDRINEQEQRQKVGRRACAPSEDYPPTHLLTFVEPSLLFKSRGSNDAPFWQRRLCSDAQMRANQSLRWPHILQDTFSDGAIQTHAAKVSGNTLNVFIGMNNGTNKTLGPVILLS